MAAEAFFLTIHPEPRKKGTRIEKSKFDLMREAILKNLRTYGTLSFTKLENLLEDQLLKNFDGSVMWYFTTVKLDLEARGVIRRVPNTEPQQIEIAM